MTTINNFPTIHYSQPEEYRLSHDSVFFARQVFDKLQDFNLSKTSGLDICSGSGIVGMDFLFHLRQENRSLPQSFDFLEIQDIYRDHFIENQKRLGPLSTKLQFLNLNYNELQKETYHEKYDLILSAPPYFLIGKGKLSPSEFKNRCRFFIDSDLKNLILGIANSLKKSGSAFLILRDLPEHRYDVIAEAQSICEGKLKLEVLGDIRGTHFVQLVRL